MTTLESPKSARRRLRVGTIFTAAAAGAVVAASFVLAEELGGRAPTSYSPVAVTEEFSQIRARLVAARPDVERRQAALLTERYDLSDRKGLATMSKGKPLQEGVRAKLAPGVTWEEL